MESSSVRSSAPESQLISRRTLVRAGATVAWTVPLVQVVAAAPALAVSNGTTLALAVPTGNYTSATALHVTASVTNSGTKATQNLQLSLTLPTPASGTVTAPGWTVTGSGTTYVFTANAPLSATASLGFDVVFSVSANPPGSVDVVATATNAPTQSKSGGVTGYATSTTLQWASAISGGYVATNANLLDVTTSVKNNGAIPATSFQIKIILPFTATGVASVSGWVATGSGSVWTFTRSNSLGAGATDGFTARFNVANYGGGNLAGVASASNVATAVNSSATITAAPSTLSFDLVKSSDTTAYVPPTSAPNDTGNKAYVLDFRVHNNGPRSIKDIVVTISCTKNTTTPTVGAGWTLVSSTQGAGNDPTSIVVKYTGVVDVNGNTAAPANVSFTTKGNAVITLPTQTASSAF